MLPAFPCLCFYPFSLLTQRRVKGKKKWIFFPRGNDKKRLFYDKRFLFVLKIAKIKTRTSVKNDEIAVFYWFLLTFKGENGLFTRVPPCFYIFMPKLFSKHQEEIKKHAGVFLLIDVYIVDNIYTRKWISQKRAWKVFCSLFSLTKNVSKSRWRKVVWKGYYWIKWFPALPLFNLLAGFWVFCVSFSQSLTSPGSIILNRTWPVAQISSPGRGCFVKMIFSSGFCQFAFFMETFAEIGPSFIISYSFFRIGYLFFR